MRLRISRQNREIAALILFTVLAIRIVLAYIYPFTFYFISNYSERSIVIGSGAIVVGLSIFIVIAIVRFVILIRKRVSHGHCPHCGRTLAPTANECSTCSRPIAKRAGEHERRSISRGMVHNGFIFLAWISLGAWAASFDFDLHWATPRFAGGEGVMFEASHGHAQLTRRRSSMPDGSALPNNFMTDLLDAIEKDGVGLDHYWHVSLGANWWFKTDVEISQLIDPWRLRQFGHSNVWSVLAKYKADRNNYYIESRCLDIPMWIPTAALLPIVLILRYRARAYPPGCCQTCGYDLHNVKGPVCPECGTAKTDSTYGVPTQWPRRKQPSLVAQDSTPQNDARE